jgi:hypothetical protein
MTRHHSPRSLFRQAPVDLLARYSESRGLARLLGWGDAGRKVELAVRRGQGDPELGAALQRDTEGKWEQVSLLDHIAIGGNDCFSFAEHRLL